MKNQVREFPVDLPQEQAAAAFPAEKTGGQRQSGLFSDREAFGLSTLETLFQAAVSVVGLILLSPLFLLIAALIKLTSRGPVFYRGERVGRHEKRFVIIKFRTLEVDAEKKIGARLLNKNDHFYTPIGRFLKQTKLDELPQLFNVIKGEMSLVGPRPIRPIFWERLKKEIPNYWMRFLVRPGITGLAQIRGGYFTHPRNKLRYERFYIQHRTFATDMKLIVLTLLKLLNRWITLGFVLLFLFLFVSFVPAELRSGLYVELVGIQFNLLHLVVILLGSWLVAKKIPSHRLYLYRCRINLPIVCFIAVGVVGALFSEIPIDALRGTAYFAVTGFFIALLIINSGIKKPFVTRAARIASLSCVALSVFGLLRLVIGGNMVMAGSSFEGVTAFLAGPGIRSTMASPIILATYLILGMPLLLTELTHSRTREARDFWVACATITLGGILLTRSLTGLLGLLLTMAVYTRHYLQQRLVNGLIIAFVVTVILLSIGVNFISMRSNSIDLVRARSDFASWLGEVPKGKILLGVGSRGLPQVGSSLLTKDKTKRPMPEYVLENGHLRLMLENGIVGWGVMMWIVWSILGTLSRAYKTESDAYTKGILWAAFSAILGFLVSLNGFNAFSSITMQLFFWSLVGVVVAIAIHHSGNGNGFRILWRFRTE